MTTEKMKVLYIASWGRSGTTILSNILGELDGFFAGGEIYQMWQRGLAEHKLCGCGQEIPACDVWSDVLERSGIGAGDARMLTEMSGEVSNMQVMLSEIPGGRAYLAGKLARYTPYVERLYRAIRETSGARVIVDQSGTPAHAYILSTLPDVELSIVHMIRDPRAVAHSLMRKKAYDISSHSELMEQRTPLFTALGWSVWNAEIERLWGGSPNYMRITYEQFIADPETAVREMVELCGETVTRWPFVGNHRVSLRQNHNLSGNPSRFKTGEVDLALDDEWQTAMRPVSRAIVTGICAPLMLRYGYLGGGSGSGAYPRVAHGRAPVA